MVFNFSHAGPEMHLNLLCSTLCTQQLTCDYCKERQTKKWECSLPRSEMFEEFLYFPLPVCLSIDLVSQGFVNHKHLCALFKCSHHNRPDIIIGSKHVRCMVYADF